MVYFKINEIIMIINITDQKVINSLLRENRNFDLVFTSGCFDLLHPGHIYFLQEMITKTKDLITKNKYKRELKTFVTIHSDTEIKKRKGKNRPVYNSIERSILLNALKGIDFVAVWDGWENITDLVFLLTPEFIAANEKSLQLTNWENNYVNVAKKIGATLIGVPISKNGISTTEVISRIIT